MVSPKIALLALAILSGCESKEDDPARATFGAGMVAGFIVNAQAKCAADGKTSIAECADALPPFNDARMAALVAQDAYKTFQGACYPDMGMSKCEGLVEQAYQEAQSR